MSFQDVPPKQPTALKSRRPLWLKFIAYLIFMPALLGGAASLFFLKNYLPSHEWLTASAKYSMVIGAAAAILVALAASVGMGYQAIETGKQTNIVVRLFVFLVTIPMIYLLVGELVVRGIPATIAMSVGTAVEHHYVVDKLSAKGGRKCERPISFEGLNWQRLCGMPQSFSDGLAPGMPVIFIGTGTWMGLFVEDFRIP